MCTTTTMLLTSGCLPTHRLHVHQSPTPRWGAHTHTLPWQRAQSGQDQEDNKGGLTCDVASLRYSQMLRTSQALPSATLTRPRVGVTFSFSYGLLSHLGNRHECISRQKTGILFKWQRCSRLDETDRQLWMLGVFNFSPNVGECKRFQVLLATETRFVWLSMYHTSPAPCLNKPNFLLLQS